MKIYFGQFVLVSSILFSGVIYGQDLSNPNGLGVNNTEVTNPESDKASLDAANQFIKQVDQGEFLESWNDSSIVFQMLRPQNEWKLYLDAMRVPHGSVKSREVRFHKAVDNPPNMIPGEYMVVLYKTTFSDGFVGDELVTLNKGRDGKWSVIIYLIGQHKGDAEQK